MSALKRKHTKQEDSHHHTPVLAAKLEKIDPANLRTTEISAETMAVLQPPQTCIDEVASTRFGCKLYELIFSRNAAQIHACVKIGQNCLIEGGILPICTNDPTDERVVNSLFEMLPNAPIVYSIAMIFHIMLISPLFCQYLAKEFGVDRGQLDYFANDVRSEVTAHQTNYIMGVIRDSRIFVTYATQQWLEHRRLK